MLVWSIVLAIAFTVGIVLFVNNQIKTSREAALQTAAAEVELKEKTGTSMLDAAAGVATPFITHLGAGRFDAAYELLATPFQNAISPGAFAKTCRASALLAGARSVTLNRLRQQTAGRAATIEASGVLDSSAGAVPIAFVFLQEKGRLRILVVSVAGVPVLQGVSSR